MNKKIKRIAVKEFRDFGFLQEVNRLFFHPLGLALEVIINDEDTSDVKLGGIWDYRDDPEGILFDENMIEKEKINQVEKLRKSKINHRAKYDFCNPETGIQEK